ncbi:DUF378 domain-containing protein [bacterium]|nr:DUF378 domain-containing protein [bacterium]|tara:strand:+ start:342 stop:572 length:231 start_codon:yes stop_codon:yes gene_type:complete
MQYIHKVTFLLVIAGGLNWLVWGAIGWEIGQLFGGMDMLISRGIYILIGLAALYEIFAHRSKCKECDVGGGGGGQV